VVLTSWDRAMKDAEEASASTHAALPGMTPNVTDSDL
jgi:hypothetical protein